ncbi:outer membrane protein, OMP85 family [Xylariaceae sp. FL0255]|nr:outer membrane protein, OMP85 family [Xylariaceae sp. FL0255]
MMMMMIKEASSVEQRAATTHLPQSEQERIDILLGNNQSRPVTLSSIQILGANNTRKSFLNPFFQPLVEDSRNANYTLSELMSKVGAAVRKLHAFDIFHPEITVNISEPPQFHPDTSPTDLDLTLRVRERSRVRLQTGTDVGNTEGSAYGNVLIRNIFGGAESLSVNAATGTRTRSSYNAEFSTPVANNPNLKLSLDGLASSTQKPWASHEELLKSGGLRLNWAKDNGDRYQVAFSSAWRQLTGLSATASPSVRADAGDSVKNSISYMFLRDRRDNPMLPEKGYMVKSTTELAGWGSLGGDVAFSKSEAEMSVAMPVTFPGAKTPSGISVSAGMRAGMLYPLPLSYGLTGATLSRLNDRFTLGGPTDVRGFSLGGLGPRDGNDALGGDVFAAVSVSMFLPIPRTSPDSPFRIQLFANGGRSVAVRNHLSGSGRKQQLTSGSVWNGVLSATKDVVTGMPSIAAGVGLVYAHPVARFELNFSLPIVLRKSEEARKGLQVGVGINFL